jgi:tRNA nucleotidyltransferase/poly(A) polymerase
VGDVVTFYNHEVVSTKIAKAILARLKFSNKDTEKILTLIRWHQFTVDERQTDSALRRFIRHVGKENLEDMLALRIGDRLGGGATETSWRLELFKKRLEEVQQQPFSVTDLKVDGNDVMKVLGVPPGPVVGKVLNDLFAEVEAGKLKNEQEDLLKRMKELKIQ